MIHLHYYSVILNFFSTRIIRVVNKENTCWTESLKNEKRYYFHKLARANKDASLTKYLKEKKN